MGKVSGLVITYNEGVNLPRCLDSLWSVVDEVVVVDSFSEDNTREVCESRNVRFYQREYLGQVAQKQFALSLATYDYVLSLDGDEALDERLISTLTSEKERGFSSDGYYMNRLSKYGDHWVYHGGWHPQWRLRLWNKHKCKWAGKDPHDVVLPMQGFQSQRLNGKLLHFAYEGKWEHEKRLWEYANISARSQDQTQWVVFRLVMSPLVKFIKDYIFKKGFLDGKVGWQIAWLSMKGKYLKYRLIYQARRKR